MSRRPITWRNINAPDFSGANAGFASGVNSIQNALQGFQQQIGNRQEQQENLFANATKRNTEEELARIAALENMNQYKQARENIGSRLDREFEQGSIDKLAVRSALDQRDNQIMQQYNDQAAFDENQFKQNYGADISALNTPDAVRNFKQSLIQSDSLTPEGGQLLNKRLDTINAQKARERQNALADMQLATNLKQKEIGKAVPQAMREFYNQNPSADLAAARQAILPELSKRFGGENASTVMNKMVEYQAANYGLTDAQKSEIELQKQAKLQELAKRDAASQVRLQEMEANKPVFSKSASTVQSPGDVASLLVEEDHFSPQEKDMLTDSLDKARKSLDSLLETRPELHEFINNNSDISKGAILYEAAKATPIHDDSILWFDAQNTLESPPLIKSLTKTLEDAESFLEIRKKHNNDLRTLKEMVAQSSQDKEAVSQTFDSVLAANDSRKIKALVKSAKGKSNSEKSPDERNAEKLVKETKGDGLTKKGRELLRRINLNNSAYSNSNN